MRILVATTAGAGHFEPMTPFVRAAVAAGHDVLVASPAGLEAAIAAEGWEHALLPSSDPAVAGPIYASLPTLPRAEADVAVIRDIFGGANAQAALPRLVALIDEHRPDLVLREPAELASYVAAVRAGVEQVQVAIGLRRLDELVVDANTPALQERFGIAAAGLRDVRTLSLLPPSLDVHEDSTLRPREHYRRDDGPVAVRLPAGWAAGDDRPLVYATFGTVAAQIGFFPRIYRTVLDALADAPVRVLLTVGREADPDLLGALPGNAHVERWWPQDAILPGASVVVGHGGFGTTMGGLRAGLPLVVLPLFSCDQFLNADAVEAVGAGVVVRDHTVEAVREAALRALTDAPLRTAAQGVAAEVRSMPPAAAWLSHL